MLNQALRRTSGSNVQTMFASPCSTDHSRWCSFICRPSPVLRTPGRMPGHMALQHQLAVVASEESERSTDHPVVAERPGDVATGMPRARSNSTPMSGVIVPHT